MFANPTFVVGSLQRVVATLVVCAVTLFSFGVHSTAQAANLTLISDTLTDSDLSVTAGHTIAFTIPAGSTLAAISTFTIEFPTGPGTGFTDVNTVVSGDVTATVAGAGSQDSFSVLGQVITISLDTIGNAGEEVVVVIADGKIVNPDTAGSDEVVVTTPADIGKTRVALVDNVLVTAIVETRFDFSIDGLATSTINVNGTTTTGSTTATAIPFGLLVAGETKTMAQKLTVVTNAKNGFVVTVEQDANLLSTTGADIDSFFDGTDVDTPTDWDANLPTNTLGSENEYGHWGLTSTDGNLQGAGTAFTATNQYVAASTTPRAVFAHNGSADGLASTTDATGDDIGQTTVGYQIHITPLQEAADDYNTTLTYIATPTF